MNISRRDFLKKGAMASSVAAIGAATPYAHDLLDWSGGGPPMIRLGRTGVRLPRIALAFDGPYGGAADLPMLHKLADDGYRFWDVALGQPGLERMAPLLAGRRESLFIACRSRSRTPAAARHELEQALAAMGTGHIDLYQLDGVRDPRDVRDWEFSGRYRQLLDWQAAGLVRFIGVSGQDSASALRLAVERYEFDTLRLALPICPPTAGHHAAAVTAAAARDMGILLDGLEQVCAPVTEPSLPRLIGYGLSREHVQVAVLPAAELQGLAARARPRHPFIPLSAPEVQSLHVALAPVYQRELFAV